MSGRPRIAVPDGPSLAAVPTVRQLQALTMLAEGLAYGGGAREMGIEVATFACHIQSLLKKVKASNAAHAMKLCHVRGYLELPEAPPAIPVPVLRPDYRLLLDLMADGLTDAQIGIRLGLTEETINQRVRRLYQMLGVRRRPQAVYVGYVTGNLTVLRPGRRAPVVRGEAA